MNRFIPLGGLVFLAGVGTFGLQPFAQDVAPTVPFVAPPTQFECRFVDEQITIDGAANDPAWKTAQIIDNFYLPWLKPARAAKAKTRARLLWDRENLYFFAEMDDADLFADIKEHDGETWNNDVFEVFLKPSERHGGYYEFHVTPAGTMMDMFLPKREKGGFVKYAKKDKFHLETKVIRNGTLNDPKDRDKGWSVEGRIPWTDFLRTGGRPEVNETWKFALCRYDYPTSGKDPELSTNAPLKSNAVAHFHHYEDYASLKFTGPARKPSLPEGLNKRLALTTSTVVGFPDPPPPYRVKRVYPKLDMSHPIGIHRQPGSDQMLLIHAQSSYGPTKIGRFKDSADAVELETVLDLTDTVYDLTFHPKFAENGFVYVGSNGKVTKDAKKMTRVTRYTMERKAPYHIDPKSAVVIIEWRSDGHNGAAVAFGHDDMLYVTAGDGTSDSDTNLTGQDMTTLLAKVLRIDVDNPVPGKHYSVPKDNPFVDMKDARPEIWAIGFRNPWRMTVDAKTGHLWIAQNGQDLWEQAYLVKKGENYGWSVMEGSHPFYLDRKKAPNFFTKPTVEHHHSEARSLTGGIVYYGKKHPDLQGAYIYGDYSTGRIWAVKHDSVKVQWHKEIAQPRLAITGFGIDHEGEIVICDHQGKGKAGLYTLEATPPTGPSTFPRKLSDSGLFESVKGHVMKPALIPYSVNAVLWSDGAQKQRWLALPSEVTINFPSSRGWNFPDKTVIVKSFFIDDEEGNAATRRWIETRFLTRQEGEWHGYSYAWNKEQTEGTLVETNGADRKFTIKVKPSKEHPDGVKILNWRYPSRSDCMVCHSRAANWVLGLSDIQFNTVHDHGGTRENQLHTLERLGMIRSNWLEQTKKDLREAAKARGMSDDEASKYVNELCANRDQRPAGSSTLLAKNPEKYPHLVDPHDLKADLTLRARSYFHANCANCHVEAGGGNSMIDLAFTVPLEKMKLIGEVPQHHTFGIKDAKLIYPGHPEKSTLLRRVGHRGEGFMPPLATREVDHAAVRMLEEWVRSLK